MTTFADVEAFKASIPLETCEIFREQIRASKKIIRDPAASIDELKQHAQIIKDINERLTIGMNFFVDERRTEMLMKEIY